MLAVHVSIQVKPEFVDQFIAATILNAKESLKEPGIAQFDFTQQQDDPTRFALVEVFRNSEAPAFHKATAHFAVWRETVAEMMAAPRSSVKYETIHP